jgi:hypothetical protein
MISRRWLLLDIRICWTVLVAFCMISLLPVNSGASLVESRLSTGETLSRRTVELNKIRQTLEKGLVAQRLADYGFSQEEVQAKLPTLSDEQLHQLAGLSDSLAEGGNGVELVIAVLLIVLLVVIILKLQDKQVIIR